VDLSNAKKIFAEDLTRFQAMKQEILAMDQTRASEIQDCESKFEVLTLEL
jgi:hypothetical protein